MTLSPIPADTRAFLRHLDNHGLLAHVRAACDLLAERGITVPPTLLDELAQGILEDIGRTPGGLDFSVAPSDSAPRSRPEGAEHLYAAPSLPAGSPPGESAATSKVRPHIIAKHAGVPLRLVTTEAV